MNTKLGYCGVGLFAGSLCYVTVTMERTNSANRRAPPPFTLDDLASEFVQISAMYHCRLGIPTGGTDKMCHSCLTAYFGGHFNLIRTVMAAIILVEPAISQLN